MIHLDNTILQSKTVCNIIKVLKEAGTITKTGSNDCTRINEDIQTVVKAHTKAVKRIRSVQSKLGKNNITEDYIPKTDSTYRVRWGR